MLFSCSVMSNSETLSYGLQESQASLSFTVSRSLLRLMPITDSCPLSQWCHLTISFSVTPFSSCPHSSPASGSFPVSRFFTSGTQSIGASASGLISFRIDWFDLLAVQGSLKSLLQHHSSKASIFCHWAFYVVQLSHSYMTTGKTIALIYGPLMAKWCLCFLIHCPWATTNPFYISFNFIKSVM